MSDDHKSVLLRTFEDVLEQLAFMFTDPPESTSPELEDNPLIEVSMGFRGPFSGVMKLVVPRAMCEVLAANALGLEPEDELVKRAPFDTVKELLNIICGNVLTEIAGEEPVFDLEIPAVRDSDAEHWHALQAKPTTVYCLADDYPVLVHLDTSS